MGRISTTIDDTELERVRKVLKALGISESVWLRNLILKELVHIHHIADKRRSGENTDDVPDFYIDTNKLKIGAQEWFRRARTIERTEEDKAEKIYRYRHRNGSEWLYQSVSMPRIEYDMLKKALGVTHNNIPGNIFTILAANYITVWGEAMSVHDDIETLGHTTDGEGENDGTGQEVSAHTKDIQ